MTSARQEATLANGQTTCLLMAYRDPHAPGVILSRRVAQSGQLTAVRSEQLVFEFFHNKLGNPKLTRDNPFLKSPETLQLDALGIVKVGTTVQVGMVAVSALMPGMTGKRARSGYRMVQNDTCRFTRMVDGYTVTRVIRKNNRDRAFGVNPRLVDQVMIDLQRHDPVEVGDLLAIDTEVLQVVEVRNDDDMPRMADQTVCEVVIPCPALDTTAPMKNVAVSRLLPTARDETKVRDTGAYSLIGMQPLLGEYRAAFEISAWQVQWLLANGYRGLAGELASLKSDDLTHRSLLKEVSQHKACFPLDITPGAPETLAGWIEHLRLLGLAVECTNANDHVRLRMQPADRNAIQQVAPTEIRKPDTLNYRTYQPERGGLFCEQAFGPETGSRRRVGAHVRLATPIVPAIFRLGNRSILSRLLKLESDELDALLSHKLAVDNGQRLVPYDDRRQPLTGARAIQFLLSKTKIRCAWPVANLVQDFVYVMSPDWRPLVLLDNGNFATSDLNDLYRVVINRNNRLKKLIDLKAPPVIIASEERELQLSVDQLQANGQLHAAMMGSAGRPLKSGLDLVLDKMFGAQRKSLDWTGWARAIVDSTLETNRCRLPGKLFTTLQCQEDTPVLLGYDQELVACYPSASDEAVIRLSPTIAQRLALNIEQPLLVHRPITRQGVQESIDMMRAEPRVAFQQTQPLSASASLDLLIERIRTMRELELTGADWILVGGTGSVTFPNDTESPFEQHPTVEVPADDLKRPNMSDLIELYESLVKTSLRVEWKSVAAEPGPGEGRLGGVPWLPSDVAWPVYEGKPVPFVAQLPIGPELSKSLPFEIKVPSMLTVFWDQAWWEQPATTSPCILIHGIDDLHRATPPEGAEIHPLVGVTTELIYQLPHFSELDDVLECYFDEVPKALLKELQGKYADDPRAVTEETRVGGHAYPIQSGIDNFVAQVFSNDHWSIADAGCLAICGDSPTTLTGYVQSY